MKCKVQWNYQSGLGGPWQAGDEVNLDEALVEAINRDSPGVLAPVVGEPAKEEEPGARDVEAPPQDRQVKGPARRRDREGDPGDQGAMTKTSFKATKG